MRKPAVTDQPIHPLLAERWSPRAFDETTIDDDTLRTLFEAARWAPSCYNEQPWRFLVAKREDTEAFVRMLRCLVEANQVWASHASALVITVARMTFTRNDRPNPHAWHDLGLAVGTLTVQASALGLSLHQMAGFDGAKARATYGIPEGFEPVTALAIGRVAAPDVLPEALAERERAPRERRPAAELVFSDAWERAY